MALPPLTLTGQHVRLEPLAGHHAAALVCAANADRSSFGYTSVPSSEAEAATYIDELLSDAAADRVVPFAQCRADSGQAVGCTRLMNLVWWPGRVTPAEVEIGGTWLAAAAQRTAINTEAKLLLLTHSFEAWDVHRVAICTDARNAASRAAIERLGAGFEGVLRNHRRRMGAAGGDDRPRDSAMYSITPQEWPAVRQRLVERLRR
jgi:N-acetyltransferase